VKHYVSPLLLVHRVGVLLSNVLIYPSAQASARANAPPPTFPSLFGQTKKPGTGSRPHRPHRPRPFCLFSLWANKGNLALAAARTARTARTALAPSAYSLFVSVSASLPVCLPVSVYVSVYVPLSLSVSSARSLAPSRLTLFVQTYTNTCTRSCARARSTPCLCLSASDAGLLLPPIPLLAPIRLRLPRIISE